MSLEEHREGSSRSSPPSLSSYASAPRWSYGARLGEYTRGASRARPTERTSDASSAFYSRCPWWKQRMTHCTGGTGGKFTSSRSPRASGRSPPRPYRTIYRILGLPARFPPRDPTEPGTPCRPALCSAAPAPFRHSTLDRRLSHKARARGSAAGFGFVSSSGTTPFSDFSPGRTTAESPL